MKSQDAYKIMFREYPDVVNAHQLCEMLGGINIKTAYKILQSGVIKSFIIGNRYMIPKISVFEYLGLVDTKA